MYKHEELKEHDAARRGAAMLSETTLVADGLQLTGPIPFHAQFCLTRALSFVFT
jgi:hypothetical protein